MAKRIRGDVVTEGGIEALLAAAQAHGEQSEPDHEVGDLQEILRACWAAMTPRARRQILDGFRDFLADWIPEDD
jgi:hypothetical protein